MPARPRIQEHTHFFTVARAGGLECLTATFRTHRYAPHAHETFVVGAIEHGHGAVWLRGADHHAGAGMLTLYNPQAVHDGRPEDGGFSYRVSYPSEQLLRALARGMGARSAEPRFGQPVVHDPEGAALFVAAHRACQQDEEALRADELLVLAYTHCLVRHARLQAAPTGREHGPVREAIAVIHARYADNLRLDTLCAAARLPQQRLIAAFRRHTGLTPHAYLVNRRIAAARTLLAQRRAGDMAAVAAATGFCDQAHMIRVFKARVGITPGAYRAAVLGAR